MSGGLFFFGTMLRTVITYGFALSVLFGVLKYVEYNYFFRILPLETYIGIIAVIFASLGIWAGRRLRILPAIPAETQHSPVEKPRIEQAGISKREYEVLELIALGLSNQEIADRLFVSTSTVKTHISNLYSKLGVKRRTEALRRAKELQLIA